MAYMRLGDLLVSSGIITGEQLEQALALPREDGQRLGDVLIRQGVISEAQLIDALRVQLGVDFVDLTAVSIPVELAKYVPRNLAKKFLVVPVQCHLVSKKGTSQRQHTAKRKQAVCCFLRHQGITTKRIGKSALKRMFKSQELCYSIGEAGRRFLR